MKNLINFFLIILNNNNLVLDELDQKMMKIK